MVIGDATQAILVALAAVAVAVFVAITYFFITFFGLWTQAVLANAGVGLSELVGMYLRRQKGKPHHYRLVTQWRITAAQAGVPVSLAELERHHLAGGDVAKVLKAVIAANEQHVPMSFASAAAMDLAGRDQLQVSPSQGIDRTSE
jgi:uncharacterized protein YqfA (UPF0365 family)